MQRKVILLGTFTKEDFLEDTINKIIEKTNIDKKNIFVYSTSKGDILLTYKVEIIPGVNSDIRSELRKTIQLHKKGDTFFTINALNKLIEVENDLPSGNIEYSQYTVDWNKFKNKLILLQRGELELIEMTKI